MGDHDHPPYPPAAPAFLEHEPEMGAWAEPGGPDWARMRMHEGREAYQHNVELDPRHAQPGYSEETDETMFQPPAKYKDFPSYNPDMRKEQTRCDKKDSEKDEECVFRLTEDGGEIWDPALLTEKLENVEVPEDGFVPTVEPFDVRQLGDDFTYAFFGKRREGKSFCMRYLLYHMRHLFPRVYVFTNTKINGFWQKSVPSKYVSFLFL